jgi:hypothetical protein
MVITMAANSRRLAWISVSGRWLMLRPTLQPTDGPDLSSRPSPAVLNDDFAFGASGSLCMATDVAQTVVRINAVETARRWRVRRRVRSEPPPAPFGRAPDDENALYVTTNGGFIVPFGGRRIQDAKLLRLDVGEGVCTQEQARQRDEYAWMSTAERT